MFITGTDTGIGKTWAAVALIRALRATGMRVMPMKPVASGGVFRDGTLVNDDALQLIDACALSPNYADVNPYVLKKPVSPHIAARAEGVRIDPQVISNAAERLLRHADTLVVEGAGGWLSPVDEGLWQSDLVRTLNAKVLLVVGLRLGCINHALLSARAVREDGALIAGWIGNAIDPDMACPDEVHETLAGELAAPCVGQIRWNSDTGIDVEALRRSLVP